MKIFHVEISTFIFTEIQKERLFELAGKLISKSEKDNFDLSNDHYKMCPVLDLPNDGAIVFALTKASARTKFGKYIGEVNRAYDQVREENAV